MLIGMRMGWGEWMVADITTEQQFQLEQHIRVVQQNVKNHPDRLAAVMADLLRQNVMKDAILRSATRRICELEIQLELGVKPDHRFTMHPLRRLWRRVGQVVMIGRSNV